MIIAIDYDETYTKDPILWDAFIKNAISRGHTVYCVTARGEKYGGDEVKQDLGNLVHGCYFTDGKQKEKFMLQNNIFVHVWIDDCPLSIVDKSMKESWEE